MQAKASLTPIGPPVAELPVHDVARAQNHYRDVLGFEIGWTYPGDEIGSVHRAPAVIFFRRRTGPFEPAVHWIFAQDVDEHRIRALGGRAAAERDRVAALQRERRDVDGHVRPE